MNKESTQKNILIGIVFCAFLLVVLYPSIITKFLPGSNQINSQGESNKFYETPSHKSKPFSSSTKLVFGLLIFVGFVALKRVVNIKPLDTSHGSAAWAKRSDIKNLLRPTDQLIPPGELRIGQYCENWRLSHKFLNLDRETITRHVLILGPSGSGKSRSIFLPNCYYSQDTSIIVTDPKSELWDLTSGCQSNPIRFAPREPHKSMHFNFVAGCKDIGITKQVVLSIVTADGADKGDPFWSNGEQQLLTALISHVAHSAIPTPKQVYKLLCSGEKNIAETLSKSNVETARNLSTSFRESSEKVRSGVVMAVTNKMAWLEDPKVQQFTSSTFEPFDFSSLRDIPTQLYWVLSEDDITELKALTAVFFNLAMTSLKRAESRKVPVTFIFDEFANIGKISNFETDITLLRGKDIAVIAGIQSISQIKTIYGQSEAETIFGNFNTKIILSSLEPDTAEKVSRMLGEYTQLTDKVTKTSSGGLFAGAKSIATSSQSNARPLMTADEVRKLDKKKMILVSTNLPPIVIDRVNFTEPGEAAIQTPCPPTIDC